MYLCRKQKLNDAHLHLRSRTRSDVNSQPLVALAATEVIWHVMLQDLWINIYHVTWHLPATLLVLLLRVHLSDPSTKHNSIGLTSVGEIYNLSKLRIYSSNSLPCLKWIKEVGLGYCNSVTNYEWMIYECMCTHKHTFDNSVTGPSRQAFISIWQPRSWISKIRQIYM